MRARVRSMRTKRGFLRRNGNQAWILSVGNGKPASRKPGRKVRAFDCAQAVANPTTASTASSDGPEPDSARFDLAIRRAARPERHPRSRWCSAFPSPARASPAPFAVPPRAATECCSPRGREQVTGWRRATASTASRTARREDRCGQHAALFAAGKTRIEKGRRKLGKIDLDERQPRQPQREASRPADRQARERRRPAPTSSSSPDRRGNRAPSTRQ